MGSGHRYLLTEFDCMMIESRGCDLVCYRCGEPIEVGDVVVSKPQGSYLSTKFYHAECWDGMFIDI